MMGPKIRARIQIIFFLFLHKNICCRYSLEAPHSGGASNEYPQHMFSWRYFLHDKGNIVSDKARIH